MGGSSFGKIFTITSFGESHGPGLGVIIDGCPSGIPLSEEIIQKDLDRRRPGAHASATDGTLDPRGGKLNPAMTSRKEQDKCEILSGVFKGMTTGTPIAILVRNENQKSEDYNAISQKFRPGHADYPFTLKYGIRDYRGGGRSSGRETIARVAAGAVAQAFLKSKGIKIKAWTSEAVGISCKSFDESIIEKNPLRACDAQAAEQMLAKIIDLKVQGDSGGGIISCSVTGVPVGLGEPVFDKLDALLAHAILSIGAIKGIEFGAGFDCAGMKGSEHNDAMRINKDTQEIEFCSNNAGGILGGLSSGAEIFFKAAVKPVSSIALKQKTITSDGKETEIEVHGRHDVCLCPRIVPVVEAMTALVLCDLYLQSPLLKK